MTGFKCFDKIFYYPEVMPDQVIASEVFRAFLKEHCNYEVIKERSDVIFVIPTSAKKEHTHALIQQHAEKKIVFIYWSENIFAYFRLVSQVHGALRKFKIKSSVVDALLFNPVMRRLLEMRSPIQVDTYFKDIVKRAAPNHFFILTNDIKDNTGRVFFAPYFYYFCQGHVQKILNQSYKDGNQRKFCAFIVSNPNNLDRIDIYKKLSRYKQVDSFGKVLNNKSMNDLHQNHIISDYQSNDLVYEQYKFVVCFENSYTDGYITEKIVNAIAGGAIPIYRGAPDVGNYFNLGRIIDYNDNGKSYDAMIERIIALDNDNQLYRQFLKQPVFSKDIQADIESHNNRLTRFIENVFNTKHRSI